MKIYSIFLILYFFSCDGYAQNNCKELPSSFSNYNEALNLVGNAKFSFVDYLNTSKSTIIKGAKYYSCDYQIGYLIIGVNNQRYIYQGVPVNVWNNFKKAKSFGSFYTNYIRNNYQLKLK